MEVNSARDSVDTESLSFDPLDIEVSLYLNVEFKKLSLYAVYNNPLSLPNYTVTNSP
jgi:hypothetical protein